jgi:hypothetical protein
MPELEMIFFTICLKLISKNKSGPEKYFDGDSTARQITSKLENL